jgi:hypothetical protein
VTRDQGKRQFAAWAHLPEQRRNGAISTSTSRSWTPVSTGPSDLNVVGGYNCTGGRVRGPMG